MRSRVVLFGTVLAAAAVTIATAQGRQVSPEEHARHHPDAKPEKAPAPPATQAKGMAGMKESGAKLDELVAKMNAAQGQAKVDAIAELLTALVQQHHAMHSGMGDMMSKMKAGAAAK